MDAGYYKFCDRCGAPAFRDGETSYEGPGGEAVVVALCPRCAQNYCIEIVAKVNAADQALAATRWDVLAQRHNEGLASFGSSRAHPRESSGQGGKPRAPRKEAGSNPVRRQTQ